MSGKGKIFIYSCAALLVASVLLLAASMVSGPDNHEENIKDQLIGMNITYYNIAGQPMYYIVSEGDIRSIEKTRYGNDDAWKVRIGEGLQWDVTMDYEGKKILDIDQLFCT
ncbi:hypothetical protein CUJ83_15000 [Methanocella sp. CWC-04]|uniref:Uncharacterized protein n=1 Tax=Methanooceanicella nereidis TaxID=2052831 RepID=A0AAP2W8L9_9EURY|nr:hypothetical protein [Methanocella sp. CWC-04]MCD1296309.1 hypothetical protein [Methanocella sp. CWC-04]